MENDHRLKRALQTVVMQGCRPVPSDAPLASRCGDVVAETLRASMNGCGKDFRHRQEVSTMSDLQLVYLAFRSRLLSQTAAAPQGDSDIRRWLFSMLEQQDTNSSSTCRPRVMGLCVRENHTLYSLLSGCRVRLYVLDPLDIQCLLEYLIHHLDFVSELVRREEEISKPLRGGPRELYLWMPPSKIVPPTSLSSDTACGNPKRYYSDAELESERRWRSQAVKHLFEVEFSKRVHDASSGSWR